MWPFFSPKPREHLGIDIGATSIKIVKIAKNVSREPGPVQTVPVKAGRLETYASLEAAGYQEGVALSVGSQGATLVESEVTKMLDSLLASIDGRNHEVVISIPAFSSFMDEIILPPMPDAEIPDAVMFEARSHVPVPITEVEISWQVVEDKERGKERVVSIVAVPKEIIFRYQNICAGLGLTIKALEVETFSIIRALGFYEEEFFLLLDIGARNTTISLVKKGFLRASRNIETSGEDITKVIAQGLGISLGRAEELKRDQGFLLASQNPLIGDLINPLADAIAEEALKLLSSGAKGEEVKKVILTGGSASLKGFPQYLERKLHLPIDIANPWATIEYDPRLKDIVKEKGPEFTVAVGLALY
ncbi:MAG: type IV pilus assembly protein PilM [Candidatus Portnoybacteria bacterium]|nr:type IV pilus assembly protein PilM [Candidatus Portnoybacteria bacterium]